ncbi:hypothetical protein IFDJLNFL_4896 [Methylobacterium dankookense]|uniref:Uncharacterized protein n=1 Tax=Methylobacterium dankookense TaxID=560405 RepID=A0ABQ4RP43_9HYPH|nr:hypothetical protein IFDJLNFL_4896 [Methylobacterium dankookense]
MIWSTQAPASGAASERKPFNGCVPAIIGGAPDGAEGGPTKRV